MEPEENQSGDINVGKLRRLFRSFGPGEKLFFYVFAIVGLISGALLFVNINNKFLVEVPAKGGLLIEGMTSTPRFINPVIAISDTDKSISRLVYSGLLKTSADGSYVGDLAEAVSVSEDGLVYNVKIKDNALFHDKAPVTADDVLFTIEKILDPVVKSPKRVSWEGVAVEKISDKELRFTLRKAYFPFLENLTLGILPKHVWQSISSEEFAFSNQNLEGIGSGPYTISSVEKNTNGSPNLISLKSFNKYLPREGYISEIQLVFFQNEKAAVEAIRSGSIESLGGLNPVNISLLEEGNFKIATSSMPRVFGAFFNQNQAPVLVNSEVRKALDKAVDKTSLTREILGEFGAPLVGPTSLDTFEGFTASSTEEAKAILATGGWKANAEGVLEKKTKTGTVPLTFSISTSDVPDLKRTAEILRDTWTELGAQVDIKIFDGSDLSQNVIKPRKYDVLLFGEVIGREFDLYPFWHSSERNDPGLNISLYTNITADKLLEELRGSKTIDERNSKLESLKSEINKDVPAVFLYAPEYIYVIPDKVKSVSYPSLSNPGDRFSNVTDWYINTKKVWSIFAKN